MEDSNNRIKSLEQDKAELRNEIKVCNESREAAGKYIGQLLFRLEKRTEALTYIVDHDWTCGPLNPQQWKWINEFVDVAREALKEDV